MSKTQKAAQSRSLIFQDGSSHKFWNIELVGDSHTVCYGRVNTTGQTQTKNFDSEAEAKKSYEKLVKEKLKKGYTDQGTAGSSATAPSVTESTKKVAKKSAGKKDATSKDATSKGAAKKSSAALRASPADKQQDSAAHDVKASDVTETAQVCLEVTQSIELDPADWFIPSFRPQQRLERGEPRPFDLNACKKLLSKLRTGYYGWETKWEGLDLPAALSKEEAHFWLVAMTKNRDRETKMKAFAEIVGKMKLQGDLSMADAVALIEKNSRGIPSEVVLPLANLFTVQEVVEFLLNGSPKKNWLAATELQMLVTGFKRYLKPYLTDQENANVKQLVAKRLDPTALAESYGAFPPAHYLCAALGMQEEMLSITQGWEDDRFHEHNYLGLYQNPQAIVCGLGSAELVESEWRRLKLDFLTPDQARAFLACTEYAALDVLAESICNRSNREECESLLKILVLVKAPQAAEPILRCRLEAKAPIEARNWLDTQIGNAVHGLIETAGGRGKLADAAIDYLRSVKRLGWEQVIKDALQASGKSDAALAAVAKVQTEVLDREEKTYEPLDDRTTPKWLQVALDQTASSKKKLPGWAIAPSLPPLLVGDHRLNDDQLGTVLSALASTSVTEKNGLLSTLREKIEKNVRDEFAWKVFQHWQDDGCPSKEKWAMGTIGHLGDDGCVLKLTPLIRVWPGESQHQRAVFGLECLRAIGSSVALMQLSGISQKLKFKGLKAKAELFVNEIAEEKGMTRDELEDRVIPDCGLDENGKRELSFGERTFSFVLGSDLKAKVRDQDGKVRNDLPKPSGKDDAEIAAASVAEWKLMKKQIKEVATIQSRRLENAMITGRRWNQDDFRSLIVTHPLMTHLAQKLIWSTFDANGKKSSTFRITEERDFASVSDDVLTLPADHQVGLVHALEMSAEERAAWGEVLSDYEIVAPFAQLGREVHALNPEEENQQELTRYNKLSLVAPTLVFTLEKLGWTRGVAMDGGCFDEHSKQFPAADVTAIVTYEGTVAMGYIDPNETLVLGDVTFFEGLRPPSCFAWGDDKLKKLKLAKVNPIVISEVLADLQVLKSKAK
jgi:predicted DNA-binding WGR domain protein